MTKKRLYALFAFLFAAVFALVCAFTFSACKDKDDEDDKSPDDTTETVPEGGDESDDDTTKHEHTYVVDASTWAWTDDTHTGATATAMCSDEDGLCDVTTTTVESDKVEAEDSATCTEGGTVIHKAYYGGIVVLECEGEESEALGHDYEVTFDWTETEDGWTASATRSCKRDDVESETATNVDVTSETDDEYVVYTATATFSDGTTATDVKKVPVSGESEENEDELPKVYLDFGDSSTYSWIGIEADADGVITLENEKEYSTGIVTIVASKKKDSDGNPTSPTTIENGALKIGGETAGSEGKYIAIDLTGLQGKYISIEAKMSTAEDESATLHVGTKIETPNTTDENKKGLTYAESASSTDIVTLSYVGEITQDALYLTCSKNVNIYTLSVVISDDEPEEKPEAGTCMVTINPVNGYVYPGSTLNLTAAVANDTGEAVAVDSFTWAITSGETYATVEADTGIVQVGDTVGSFTVTATCTIEGEEYSGELTIYMTEPNNWGITISVEGHESETEITIEPNETLQFTAGITLNGEEVTGEALCGTLTWTSANSDAGTITDAGLFTAGGAGETTTVNATYQWGEDGEKDIVTSSSITVTVKAAVTTDPEHVHNYVFDSFEWTDNGGVSVKAVLKCTTEDGTTCSEPEKYETATASLTESSDATCTEAGKLTYTASYTDAAGTIHHDTYQKDSVNSPATGHTWTVGIDWKETEDGWSTTSAARTCEICGTTETASDVQVSSERENGKIIYTATATFTVTDADGQETTETMTDTKEVDDPAAIEKTYTIEITSEVATVAVNGIITLTAKVTEAAAGEVTGEDIVTWTIKEGISAYVAMDEGVVTGASRGTAIVTASYTDQYGYGASVDVYIVVTPEDGTDYPPYDVSVNFTDTSSAQLGFGGEDTLVTVGENNIITYYDLDYQAGFKNDTFTTAIDGAEMGYTHVTSAGEYSNYFAIDLIQYVGYDFEITFEFALNAASGTGILAIVDDMDTYFTGGGIDLSGLTGENVATSTGSNNKQTVTVTGNIALANQNGVGGITNGTFYIIWDSTIDIYGIEITLTNQLYNAGGDAEMTALVTVDFTTNSGYNSGTTTGQMDVEDKINGTFADTEKRYVKYTDTDFKRAGSTNTGYDTMWNGCEGWTHVDTNDGINLTNYFELVFGNDYVGKTVKVEVTFTTSAASSSATLALDTKLETYIQGSTSILEAETTTGDGVTLTWTGTLSQSSLYLIYSDGITVSTITMYVEA